MHVLCRRMYGMYGCTCILVVVLVVEKCLLFGGKAVKIVRDDKVNPSTRLDICK